MIEELQWALNFDNEDNDEKTAKEKEKEKNEMEMKKSEWNTWINGWWLVEDCGQLNKKKTRCNDKDVNGIYLHLISNSI